IKSDDIAGIRSSDSKAKRGSRAPNRYMNAPPISAPANAATVAFKAGLSERTAIKVSNTSGTMKKNVASQKPHANASIKAARLETNSSTPACELPVILLQRARVLRLQVPW